MPKRSFHLALLQMQVEGGQPENNLRRATRLVEQAAQAGADVVLLPEALDLGWTHTSAQHLAQTIPHGRPCQELSRLAQTHQVHLCAGLIEKSEQQIFNSAVLLSPQGDLLLLHRKLNELEIGQNLYAQGDRLQVAHTPFGTFGLMICADAFARHQVISRTLAWMGADVILSPCAWAVPADHNNTTDPYGQLWLDNYQPVARDFHLWIAGASNVGWLTDGPWQGRKCIGCSLVVDPDGHPVLRGPYGPDAETILSATITPHPRPARGDQWNTLLTTGPQRSTRPPSVEIHHP